MAIHGLRQPLIGHDQLVQPPGETGLGIELVAEVMRLFGNLAQSAVIEALRQLVTDFAGRCRQGKSAQQPRRNHPSAHAETPQNIDRVLFSDAGKPLVFADYLDAQRLGRLELGPGARPGDEDIGLGRYRARHLGAQPLGHSLGLRS